MSARDLEGEVRELRARIATLVDEAANNERLLKRSQERELELLKAENLAGTFDAICVGLKESYALEAVTLLLLDPQHEIRHLLIADHLRVEDFPHVLFSDSLIGLAPQFNSFHRPWLGPYMGCDHQLLFPGNTGVRSVALIPLRRQDRLQGSLNFGSTDERRFSRHLATDFLAHLGVIASFAIENTINRARLVRSVRARTSPACSSIWIASSRSMTSMVTWLATWHCAKPLSASTRTFAAATRPPASAATSSSCWRRASHPNKPPRWPSVSASQLPTHRWRCPPARRPGRASRPRRSTP